MNVCKRYFQATLAVGHAYIQHALEHSAHGTFCGKDSRGKRVPANKTPEADRQRVRKHIESFPAVESHYCRKNTGMRYLDSALNVNRMHRIYVDEYDTAGVTPVSCSLYRDIFNKEYNLSFHRPKKDQCLLCSVYFEEKKAGPLAAEKEEEYQKHIQRKQESRTEKANDKKEATEKDSLYEATFDMESVLPTPYDPTGQTFYKRKLSVYNLSVFSLANKSAACYIWTEVEGQRGSNEIGTCLYKHLESLPKSVHHVVLFSDTCTGQNRNKYVTTALRHAVQNIFNIETIDQKFLERGHSHMECDTMHAAIERAKKGVKIHHPYQWLTVCQCARGSDPFTVVLLEHEAFFDFKDVARTTIRNTKTDTNGSRVNWLKIKWIRVEKSDSDAVYFKYRMPGQFRQLKIRGSSRRGCPHKMTTTLPVLYTNWLNISEAKKKDLLDLCHSGVIP